MQEGNNTHLIKSKNAQRKHSDGGAYRENISRIFGEKKVVGTAKLKPKNNQTSVVTCRSANKHGEDNDSYRSGHERIFGNKTAEPESPAG